MTEPDPLQTETDPDEPDAPDEPYLRPVDRFARSTPGWIVAAGPLGLANALEGRPERDRPVIMAEAPAGKPPDGYELIFDPEHPERSKVIVRRPAPDAPDGP